MSEPHSGSPERGATERIDEALAELNRMVRQTRERSERTARRVRRPLTPVSILKRLLGFVTLIAVAVAAPFVLLLRLSVSLYADYGVPAWLSVSAGAVGASLVLMFYAFYLAKKVGMGRYVSAGRTRVLALVVAAYCGYGLLYLSPANVKAPEIRETYRTLHPILRMSVATLVLVDGGAVITDTDRTPEDYRRMGLPPLENSLHFVQRDGYTHALDLRTVDRTEWRNRLASAYFRALGLNTLRHVGTADHLHISLPAR